MNRFAAGICGLLCLASASAAAEDRGEYRAAWITRFEWTDVDPERCRAKIVHAFDALAAANFNVAVFQIRGEAETLYPSQLEPWSELIGGKDPGFDPVALAIAEARKHGIQFHAYMNAMPMRSMRSRAAPAPNHIWHAHGPGSSDPWLCLDAEGRPTRQEYYYMSAGIPAVHVHVRKAIMDVVRRYDVDGIHLDRVRFPGPEYIHDPVSVRRFHGRGNPNLRDRFDWQREQLDKLINDLAAEIRAVKPQCVFSCSAWGIYNRHHIAGYDDFSSGYHDYYQDTWNWCRLGAMDVLMPMIYWNIPEPKPNYHELVKDFVAGVGGDHVVGGQSMFSPDENAAEVRATRELGAAGTVLFTLSGAERRGVIKRLKEELYVSQAPVPKLPRLLNPVTGSILGTVTAEGGAPLTDAWVSLVSPEPASRPKGVFAQVWPSGADGRFAFHNVPPGPVKVRAHYVGAAPVEAAVEVKAGLVAELAIAVPGAELVRDLPFLQILAPAGGHQPTAEVVHILGRTAPDCRVSMGDKNVEVFSNGAFAIDGVALNPGENKIQIKATDPAGKTATTELTVVRQPPTAAAPVSEVRALEPAEDVALLPGDALSIRVTAPPGGTVYASCEGVFSRLPLLEEKDASGGASGVYAGSLRIAAQPTARPAPVQVSVQPANGAAPANETLEATVEVWDPATVRVGETRADNVGITFGLHSVRLGGPFLSRVPAGTRFEVVGRQGGHLKIALGKSLRGWVPRHQVTMLPEGTPVPHTYFTGCDVNGDEQYDRLSVGLREKVVFAVRSEIEPSNCLYIDFFNTHHAMTWISHKSGARVIGAVTGEQIEEDWFRLTVPLRCKQNWGYWTELEGNILNVYVRRPPQIAAPPASPLSGLLLALEAGHGGASNGAMGRMGSKEKDINAAAVRELKMVLESRGAKTLLVRPGDSAPTLQERAFRASAAGADFFVSIHANAAGVSRGYLSVSGTSTYYRDKHCHLPAELVYRELLGLNWREFGVVGNFSYFPLQNTRVPGILVEQAFMSNPADEARMLEPAYQRQQAEAIADGLEEFFAAARE